MSENSQLDPAAMERLLRLGGHGFVAKMINLFGTYGAEKMAAADQACKAGNWVAVADAVHPIKSSAGNIGATKVQSLARQVEILARESNGEKLAPLLVELQGAFEAAQAELETVKLAHETAATEAK